LNINAGVRQVRVAADGGVLVAVGDDAEPVVIDFKR
jgi:hypothetical protein